MLKIELRDFAGEISEWCTVDITEEELLLPFPEFSTRTLEIVMSQLKRVYTENLTREQRAKVVRGSVSDF